jgi:hypothetical protein
MYPNLMKRKTKELYNVGETKKGSDDVFIKKLNELSPLEIAVNKENKNLT